MANPTTAAASLLEVVQARRGKTAATKAWAAAFDERTLTRAGLTDELDMPADDWRRLVGATLNRWAEGTAKPYEQMCVNTRLPMLTLEEREGALRSLLAAVPAPSEAAHVLASLSPAAMERAIAWQRSDSRNSVTDCGALALRTVAALGRKAPDWISRFDALAGTGKAHDGAYWLPLGVTSPAGLTRFLTQVPLAGMSADDAISKLRKAVAAWDTLGPKVEQAYATGIEPTMADTRVWRKAAGLQHFAAEIVDALGRVALFEPAPPRQQPRSNAQLLACVLAQVATTDSSDSIPAAAVIAPRVAKGAIRQHEVTIGISPDQVRKHRSCLRLPGRTRVLCDLTFRRAVGHHLVTRLGVRQSRMRGHQFSRRALDVAGVGSHRYSFRPLAWHPTAPHE